MKAIFSTIDRLNKVIEEVGDPEREFSFALGFAEPAMTDPNELYWLAACAIKRAQQLDDLQT